MLVTRAVLAVASAFGRSRFWLEPSRWDPGHEYKQPSEAVAAAKNGDTIEIFPGQYFDCAIVRQNDLTIEGKGPGVIMTDKTCGGKAILVTDGSNITIRNLTLQRARVPDQNGAGIRAQGGNLTIENTRFLDNETGILASNSLSAVIRIVGSEFIGNGKCEKSLRAWDLHQPRRTAACGTIEVFRYAFRPSHQVACTRGRK